MKTLTGKPLRRCLQSLIALMATVCMFTEAAFASFCYRSVDGDLVCRPRMEDIPSEYVKGAFFLKDEIVSDRATASTAAEGRDLRESYRTSIPPSTTTSGLPAARTVAPEALSPENSSAREQTKSFSEGRLAPSSSTRIVDEGARNPNVHRYPTRERIAPVLPGAGMLPAATPASPHAAPRDFQSTHLPSRRVQDNPQEGHTSGTLVSIPTNKQDTTVGEDTATKGYPPITVFAATWCPHCRALEQFLSTRGIAYRKIDVETDPIGQEKYAAEGTLPITEIGTTTIVGFQPERFDAILKSMDRY